MEFAVEVSIGRQKFRARGRSLGAGGLFIVSNQDIRPGVELTVSFRPARSSPLIRARAKVRYLMPSVGFGVEFIRISQPARRTLLRLVHRRTIARRQQPRVPLVAQVEFGKNQPLGWVKDISPGGMFVETTLGPTPGSQVQVRFNLPAREAVTRARGVVAYRLESTGIGVQFVEIAEEDLINIQSYIEKELASRRKPRAKKTKPAR
jgi:c-di-GMP-binding flagellar brake protein YcgR